MIFFGFFLIFECIYYDKLCCYYLIFENFFVYCYCCENVCGCVCVYCGYCVWIYVWMGIVIKLNREEIEGYDDYVWKLKNK